MSSLKIYNLVAIISVGYRVNSDIKTMQEVNSNLIMLYFRLGKIVSENKAYGSNFTKQVSQELKLTFPNMKGFSERNIRAMRMFYEEYATDEKWQQLVAKLPWGHNLLLIEKIKDVLLELGKGFSFVGNQYKISMSDKDYYIDLLFYHLELRCYIVVELKATEFKPEYIGQLGFYVTAVDETLRKEYNNQTIGLLLCKEKDRLTVDWSLKSTNVPIGVSTYNVKEKLPDNIMSMLPTEEDINLHIDIKEEEEKIDGK